MKKEKSVFGVLARSLVFGLIIGIGVYFFSSRLGFKTYSAQAKILTTENDKIANKDKTAYTYAETVNSNAIKKRVIDNLKLDMEASELDKKIELKAVPNTHIMNINVKDSVKLRAEDIADEYADITVSVINELYKANAKVIDHAYPNAIELKTNEKNALRFGLAAFLTYFIFGTLLTSIRNSNIDDKDTKEEREVRKVVFTDDNKDYNEKNLEDEYINNEGRLIKEYDIEDDKEDVFEEEEDYDQSFKYVNKDEDLEDDFRRYENKDNNKDYTVIADMPKYDDGDLDV